MPLRDATPADLDDICALIRELAAYEQLGDEVRFAREQMAAALFGPGAVPRVVLACAESGETAGFALWFPSFSTFLGRPGVWLEDLFVRPEHRGRGHGRALLEHLRSLTDGRVEWDVLDWNERAIRFYHTLGARPVEGWTRYRWGPKAAEPAR